MCINGARIIIGLRPLMLILAFTLAQLSGAGYDKEKKEHSPMPYLVELQLAGMHREPPAASRYREPRAHP